jgi:hypothetical protein
MRGAGSVLVAVLWRVVWCLPVAAWAQAAGTTVSVRTGDHTTFGRVVFGVTAAQSDTIEQQGDRLVVRLPGAGAVAGTAHGTRRVISIEGGQDQAVLTLAPGSTPRVWRVDGRLVVDVFGAAAGAASAPVAQVTKAVVAPTVNNSGALPSVKRGGFLANLPAALPVRARAEAAPLQVTLVPVGPPAPPPRNVAQNMGSAGLSPVGVQGAPREDVLRTPREGVLRTKLPGLAVAPPPPVATDGLAAVRLPGDPASHEDAILVPFDREVGAAAFALGGQAHVIFDDSKPVDLSALKDDRVFGSARITLLPAAMHFSMIVPAGKRLRLRRVPDGWVVAVAAAGAPEDAARVDARNGVVRIAEPGASDTVVMEDPATGGRLLVGTVRHEGPPVAVAHRSAEFSLLPSWAGVVAAAQSDRLSLRADKDGFELAAAAGPALAVAMAGGAAQALADAGTLTRHFDFSPLPVPMLVARMRGAVGAAAAAPKLARLRPRLRAVQDMLALGLGREAAGLLRVAVQDDPAAAQNADVAALLGMADWMAGLAPEDGATPPAAGSDEAAFWRAVMRPGEPNPAAEAAVLAANWRMLLAYPEPLRRILMPKVAQALLAGGQDQALAAMLAKLPDPMLDDVRAALLARQGHGVEALALLDRLARGADRKRAAAAARQAVEIRVAAGTLGPADAAAALDKQLYAWRDDAVELALRLRVAELRARAGAWRQALAVLLEAETALPDAHDIIRAAQRSTLNALLQAGAASRLAPLDLVALVAENADLLADKETSATLAPVLVDKLLALDLPERADPLLQRLMATTGDGVPKAGLGARLAALRLDQGDAPGALAALDASVIPADANVTDAALELRRLVLRARALNAAGQIDSALHVLASANNADGLELQAQILEKRKDWAGTTAALRALTHLVLPAAGILTDAQQDLVLRLASAASQAGNMAALQEMQEGAGRRLSAGPRLELFRALTVQPIHSLADLPRSGREAAAAHALPAVLASDPAH